MEFEIINEDEDDDVNEMNEQPNKKLLISTFELCSDEEIDTDAM